MEALPPFAAGDEIVATWGGIFPAGGFGEYALVDAALAVPKPEGLSCVHAAALADSAGHALAALRAAGVQPGDRLLVLGGSGGVGSALVQLARTAEFGASFVAATSTHTDLLVSLGVDRPIDYTVEEWWALDDFLTAPFDVIIDCAEGKGAWRTLNERGRGGAPSVLRDGGRFLALVLQEWHIEMTKWYQLPALLLPPLGRQIRSRFGRFRYSAYAQSLSAALLSEVLALAQDGLLVPVMDPSGPFPSTADGAAAAFDLLRSRHAVGKVVVEMGSWAADEEETS